MSNEENSVGVTNPFSLFDSKTFRIAAVFLNGPSQFSGIYEELWHKAVWRTVVDGFANVVHASDNRCQLRPDMITGDFDSISKEAMNFYKNEVDVEVISTPDPNFIDMEKAIRKTKEKLAEGGQQSVIFETSNQNAIDMEKAVLATRAALDVRQMKVDCIVVAGIAGGRCDHALANLHALRRVHDSQMPVILLTEANITCVLLPGSHSLTLESSRRGTACGLIPLFEPAQVTTKGLKWNLNDDLMSMLGLISTSNEVESSPVFVKTDKGLLFTCEYN